MTRDRSDLKKLINQLNEHMDWEGTDDRVPKYRDEEDQEWDDRLYKGVEDAIEADLEGFIDDCPAELLVYAAAEGLIDDPTAKHDEEDDPPEREEEQEDDGYAGEEKDESKDPPETPGPSSNTDVSMDAAGASVTIPYRPDENQAEFLGALFTALADKFVGKVQIVKEGWKLGVPNKESRPTKTPAKKKAAARTRTVEPDKIDKESVVERLRSGDLKTLEQRAEFVQENIPNYKKSLNFKSMRALYYTITAFFAKLEKE